MRCVSTEGVNLSELPILPPLLNHSSALDDASMGTATTDVNSFIADVSSVTENNLADKDALDNHDVAEVTEVTSPKSDCEVTQKDSDPFTMNAESSSDDGQSTSFSSASSLAISQSENGGQRSSAFSSASSLNASESESGSSHGSTAKNTISSESSLSTAPDEFISFVASSDAADKTSHASADHKSASPDEIQRNSDTVTVPDASRPQPYRAHASPSPSTENLDHKECESKPADIVLPERYRHVLRKSGSYGNLVNYSNSSSRCSSGSSQDLTSREKDLGTALAWIRHEMIQMKEQDKVLLKRFIELRANILQLRCMYDVLGSASDLSSLDGSSVSLNEVRKSPRLRTIMRTDSDTIMSTRGMFKTSSSLSLPCSPQLSRLRWRSDDLN